MKKIICLVMCVILLAACNNKDENNITKGKERGASIPVTTTKATTSITTTEEYPIGSQLNPYIFEETQQGDFKTQDGKFLCDWDFDANKEYKVGDTITVTATITNLTDVNYYLHGYYGLLFLCKEKKSVIYNDDPTEVIKSNSTLSKTEKFELSEAGSYYMYVVRDFNAYVNKNPKDEDRTYYSQADLCSAYIVDFEVYDK